MKNTCEWCGGTGQINFFQGVSRFLLTVEECPHCAGTGQQIGEAEKRRVAKQKNGINDKKASKTDPASS